MRIQATAAGRMSTHLVACLRQLRRPVTCVCCFANANDATMLPPLQPEKYVSKLVIVPGIVTSASRPKHKATYLTLQCKECK